MKKLLAIVLFSIGCATPSLPYVREQRISDYHSTFGTTNNWFADGSSAHVILVRGIPGSIVHLQCGDVEGHGDYGFITIPASGEYRFFGQVLAKDEFASTCHVQTNQYEVRR